MVGEDRKMIELNIDFLLTDDLGGTQKEKYGNKRSSSSVVQKLTLHYFGCIRDRIIAPTASS